MTLTSGCLKFMISEKLLEDYRLCLDASIMEVRKRKRKKYFLQNAVYNLIYIAMM
jgi:hypothetical protein